MFCLVCLKHLWMPLFTHNHEVTTSCHNYAFKQYCLSSHYAQKESLWKRWNFRNSNTPHHPFVSFLLSIYAPLISIQNVLSKFIFPLKYNQAKSPIFKKIKDAKIVIPLPAAKNFLFSPPPHALWMHNRTLDKRMDSHKCFNSII